MKKKSSCSVVCASQVLSGCRVETGHSHAVCLSSQNLCGTAFGALKLTLNVEGMGVLRPGYSYRPITRATPEKPTRHGLPRAPALAPLTALGYRVSL